MCPWNCVGSRLYANFLCFYNNVKLLVDRGLKSYLLFCLWVAISMVKCCCWKIFISESAEFLISIGFGFHSNGHRLVRPFSGASGHAFLWVFTQSVWLCVPSPRQNYSSKTFADFNHTANQVTGCNHFWCASETLVWAMEYNTDVETQLDNANHSQP